MNVVTPAAGPLRLQPAAPNIYTWDSSAGVWRPYDGGAESPGCELCLQSSLSVHVNGLLFL